MKVIFGLAVILGSMLGASSVRADACSLGASRDDWQQWVTQNAGRYPNINYREVLTTLGDCQDTLESQGLTGCVNNLGSFAKAQVFNIGDNDDHGMGFDLPNRDYLARQPEDQMGLPSEFSDGLPSDWKTIARNRGWPYLEYSSGLVPNPPNGSKSRLLFLITSCLLYTSDAADE